jgi:hypothetical protein
MERKFGESEVKGWGVLMDGIAKWQVGCQLRRRDGMGLMGPGSFVPPVRK